MRKKLPEELRRKKINIMLNAEERQIILEKAKQYNYGNSLAKYVRAMCMNPNIFVEDMQGRQDIINETSKVIKELKNVTWQISQMTKNIDNSKKDILQLQYLIRQVEDMINDLKFTIIRKLKFDYKKEVTKKNF